MLTNSFSKKNVGSIYLLREFVCPAELERHRMLMKNLAFKPSSVSMDLIKLSIAMCVDFFLKSLADADECTLQFLLHYF